MANETDRRIQDTSTESSIFSKNFKYLNIPREVFDLKGLNLAERIILSRVIYWSRKGRACRETNRQFAELIGQSEGTARRAIANLIKLGHLDGYYLNIKNKHQRDGYRDLTALVGVDGKTILNRKAAQLGQNMGRSNTITDNNSPKEPPKEDKGGGCAWARRGGVHGRTGGCAWARM